MRRSPLALRLAPFLLALGLTGCLDHPLEEVEYERLGESFETLHLDPQRKVDILFVIDDSGSMGEEQAALAANFASFVEQLEREDADYRIGITTTDDGNPWCDGAASEAGALQLRSCHAHLDDFVFSPGTAGEIDRRDEACLQHCPAELAELSTLPTTTDDDDTLRARPWLERGSDGSNVPEGVSTAQALACWGPQGIDGCGFESPLEAMRKALLRSTIDDEDGRGFLRDDALLQVVIVTDEADCSLGSAGRDAFDAEGSRALWPDPSALLPPSALCWSAGVTCQTGPDGQTHCDPVDLDAEGQPAGDGDSVLQPLDRYLEVLGEIDRHKRKVTGQDEPQVFLSVIAGVPTGYDGSELDYGLGDDAKFRDDFGVGAGCSSGNGKAVPPVRLRALADAFTEDAGSNLFSICDEDYSPALRAIVDRFVEHMRPACIEACVAGADEIEAGAPSRCVVVQTIEGQSRQVAPCLRAPGGDWERPNGEDLCVYAVTGEELHPTCVPEGNVELRFLRAPGAEYGEVTATCEISDNPRVDCR